MRTRTKTLAAVVLAVIALGSVSALLATAQDRPYWNDRNNRNDRRNLFSQTDLVWENRLGGVNQTLLLGFEVGRQNSRTAGA